MQFHDPCEEALSIFLHTLSQNGWLSTFLSSPTDLEQFSYAIIQPSVSLGEMSCHTHMACDELMRVLFVRSFTTGRYTVGFQVMHRVKTSSPIYENSPRYIAKTVRDDIKGYFFSITEHKLFGMREIKLAEQLSPGCRSQYFAMVRTSHFKSLVSSKMPLNNSVIRQSFIHTFHVIEMRPCPKCLSETFLECNCPSAITPKLHPADHLTEMRNIQPFEIVRKWVSFVEYYLNGLLLANPKLLAETWCLRGNFELCA